jgi:hypothetical protein
VLTLAFSEPPSERYRCATLRLGRSVSRAWAKCLVAAGRLRRTRHRFGVSQLAWISPCRRQASDLWGSDISPKALGPTDGLSAVLGRNALKEPGDCDAARHAINDTELNESQDARRLAQRGYVRIWPGLKLRGPRRGDECIGSMRRSRWPLIRATSGTLRPFSKNLLIASCR